MTTRDILVKARNRALAADRSVEQHVLLSMFQNAIDEWCYDEDENLFIALNAAEKYIASPSSGEG